MKPEEIELLSRIRGTFAQDAKTKWFHRFYSLLFGIAIPLFFAFGLYHDRMTDGSNADQWALIVLIVLIPLSSSLGWLFWKYLGDEYEFTGTAVVVRRHGRSVREISISDVQETRTSTDHHGNTALTLKGNSTDLHILLHPSLQKEIERLNTERKVGSDGATRAAGSPGRSAEEL